MRTGVSVRAKNSDLISFGQQGQLKLITPVAFITCYRTGDGTAAGESTTMVLGAELDMNGSGSVTTKSLSDGDSCTPS